METPTANMRRELHERLISQAIMHLLEDRNKTPEAPVDYRQMSRVGAGPWIRVDARTRTWSAARYARDRLGPGSWVARRPRVGSPDTSVPILAVARHGLAAGARTPTIAGTSAPGRQKRNLGDVGTGGIKDSSTVAALTLFERHRRSGGSGR